MFHFPKPLLRADVKEKSLELIWLHAHLHFKELWPQNVFEGYVVNDDGHLGWRCHVRILSCLCLILT